MKHLPCSLPAAVQFRRELFAHLEEWQTLRCNLDGCSRFRIPPFVSFVAPNLKRAEATYLDPFTLAQRPFHRAENSADKILDLRPVHLCPPSDVFNQIISGHAKAPASV